MDRPRALVVDTEPTIRAIVSDVLEQHGVTTVGAGSCADAFTTLRSEVVHLLFVDFDTTDVDPLELLHHAMGLTPTPIVSGFVAAGDLSRGTGLIAAGAFDVVCRPIDHETMHALARRCLRQLELLEELKCLRERLRSREGFHRLVGRSSTLERIREQLQALAATDGPVWFRGPEGAGKELAARTLHTLSPRRSEPFLVVECKELATVPGQLDWLSERPAGGSGANGPATPNGGILYLDEISLVPPEAQQALVRGLDDGSFRVDDSAIPAAPRVRLLAASSRNVDHDVEQGLILEELAAKLGQSVVHLPPLSERPEDIALLAQHFIDTIVEINHLQPIRISSDALGVLERHAWPGNVRQLRNAVEHAVILATDGVVRSKDLPDWVSDGLAAAVAVGPGDVGVGRRFKEAKRDVVGAFERAYLRRLLEDHGGNVTAASQEAGMLRSALQRLLRKYGLKSASFRKSRRAPSRPEVSTR